MIKYVFLSYSDNQPIRPFVMLSKMKIETRVVFYQYNFLRYRTIRTYTREKVNARHFVVPCTNDTGLTGSCSSSDDISHGSPSNAFER